MNVTKRSSIIGAVRISAIAPIEPDDEGVAGRPLERMCIVVHGDANPPHGSTEVRVKKRAHVPDDFVPASATAGADWRRGVEPAVHPERSPTLAPNPLRSVVGAPIVALPCERSTPHSTRGSRRGERDGEAPRRRRRRAAIGSGRPRASTATGERKRAIAVLVGTTPHRRTGRQRRSPPSSSARR